MSYRPTTRAAFKPDPFDFHASRAVQIAHLASYITDDQTIANYIGCARSFVARVRSEMSRNEPVRFLANRHERYGEGGNASSGMHQDTEAKIDAQDGSRRLKEKMWTVFDRHAARHGMTPYEAAVCLQNCQVRP